MSEAALLDDEVLLNMLQVAITEIDPVPDDVMASARAMFDLRFLWASASGSSGARPSID